MSPAPRGRPVLIDKQILAVPESVQPIVVQYLGEGDNVHIDLPGKWRIIQHLVTPPKDSVAPLTFQWLTGGDISNLNAVFFRRQSLVNLASVQIPLLNPDSAIKFDLESDQTHGVTCTVWYPTDQAWVLTSFDRSTLGDIGRTKVTLTLDREITDEESVYIQKRVQDRRSRSSRG